MTVLVLWDIDKTLIDAGGVDKQVWLGVCSELTGLPATRPASTSGQTDPQILLATLTAADIGNDRARELLPRALQHEAAVLAQRQDQLREAAGRLPGARQALRALSGARGWYKPSRPAVSGLMPNSSSPPTAWPRSSISALWACHPVSPWAAASSRMWL
jgi:hypothetical protein